MSSVRTVAYVPGCSAQRRVRGYAPSIDLNPSPELLCNSTSPYGRGSNGARGSGSDHHLAHHAPAVHLVFEIDHRRACEMPGQAGTRSAAAGQFLPHNAIQLTHAIGLYPAAVLTT